MRFMAEGLKTGLHLSSSHRSIGNICLLTLCVDLQHILPAQKRHSTCNTLPYVERVTYILVILQENMKIAIFAEHRVRRNPLKEDLM